MIIYTDSLESITAENLTGFFVGWPSPPTPDTHLRILRNSTHIVLAVNSDTGQVVGFINAVSDNIMAGYIPLLEVLPDYQHRGTGSELLRRMLDKFRDLYMVDLLTDADKAQFYSQLGMRSGFAMVIRNFDHQNCE